MKIMLACNVGMSTSLMVKNMLDAASEQGKNYEIWAVDSSEISNQVGNFDVLLLGPQVRHMLKKVKRIVGDDTPVDVITPMAYGRGDGAAVLKQAEELLGGNTNV